jgi:iron-sulfur cluster repair protein YtfE (RIC family)
MKSTDPAYVPKLKELWALLWQHIQEEEKIDLPALEQSLKAQGEETEFLARRFDRTKKFVPTRSHPRAGEKPPFETVMGLMAAPMDKLADILRKFPDQSKL